MSKPRSIMVLCIILSGAFGLGPASGQNREGRWIARGRELFTRVWTVRDGLGPEINARSCAGCHATPSVGGSGTDPRALVLLSPAVRDPTGGHVTRQLRVLPLGAVSEQATPPNAVLRKPPALYGSGALEAVPMQETRVSSSGPRGREASGRFGWKGRLRSLDEAVTAAFANELGLGSTQYPEASSRELPHKGRELSDAQLQAVVAFVRSLPPLAVRPGSKHAAGRELFQRLGCSDCHRPTFPSLEQRDLFPYTDLRLHKMGPALADGILEAGAAEDEFRTPPLWGVSKTGPPYLHDGRATSLHEAVTAHGGDAEASAIAYGRLSMRERALLLQFLRFI